MVTHPQVVPGLFALRRRHSVAANAVAGAAGVGVQDAPDESGALVVLDLPPLVDGPCMGHTMLLAGVEEIDGNRFPGLYGGSFWPKPRSGCGDQVVTRRE
jgi:hypothetical protein